MSSAFAQKKNRILEALNVPNDSYSDLSPKGSVDEGIRDLITEINAFAGLVTTSSCAGRISVFLEGKKKKKAKAKSEEEEGDGIAGPGGKGGGRWLFVSHDPVTVKATVAADGSRSGENLHSKFSLERAERVVCIDAEASLVHFKFEPMVL
jgi:tRNA wybutosine-synthesizing protein 3